MKRWLLIFLLTVLPLQMSWAAITIYCQHEQSQDSQHVGHHEHTHQKTAEDTQKNKSLLTVDADCGFCHLGGGVIFNMPSYGEPIFLHAEAVTLTHTDFAISIRPERPERPKWARAV